MSPVLHLRNSGKSFAYYHYHYRGCNSVLYLRPCSRTAKFLDLQLTTNMKRCLIGCQVSFLLLYATLFVLWACNMTSHNGLYPLEQYSNVDLNNNPRPAIYLVFGEVHYRFEFRLLFH